MSALHRAWLFDQAAALEYRRCMAELDAYANPSEPVRSAAQELRAALREQRETRHAVPGQAGGQDGQRAGRRGEPGGVASPVASNNYVN